MIRPCNQSFSSQAVTKEGGGEGRGFLPSAAKKPPGGSRSPVPASTPWDVTDPPTAGSQLPRVSRASHPPFHAALTTGPSERGPVVIPILQRMRLRSGFTQSPVPLRLLFIFTEEVLQGVTVRPDREAGVRG